MLSLILWLSSLKDRGGERIKQPLLHPISKASGKST